MDFSTFFRSLFGGNSEERLRQKQLNNIYKSFKQSKYHYLSKEGTLLATFVTKLWHLYSDLNVTKSILEQTIFAEDTKKALLYTVNIAGNFLPKETAQHSEDFTQDIIYQRIIDSDNQSKMLKTIDNEFNSYKNNYNNHNLSDFAIMYDFLQNLHNLQSFDYEGLFRNFDRTFNYNQTTVPMYNPVSGKIISDQLKDLYYLIASASDKVDAAQLITALCQRIAVSDAKPLIKAAMNSIAQVYKLLDDDLSADRMLNLCRYITKDVNLKIPLGSTHSNIIEKVRKQLEDSYKKTRERIIADISENTMEEDIKQLFQKIPLESLDWFDPDINTGLAHLGYETINYMQHIRVTKTFINKIYETHIKESINTLIIEGYFPEKEYQNKLAEKFFALNELKKDFAEAELTLYQGSGSIETLHSFLVKSKSQKNQTISKLISMINSKAFKANAFVAAAFLDFGMHLFEILKDYKKPKGTIVSNIKQIKGVQNKQYIAELVNGYNSIAKYCKMMKPFIRQRSQKEDNEE